MRAERAAERTAEIAAAEDFDPLRIRPYVTLPAPRRSGPDNPPSSSFGGFREFDTQEIPRITHEYEIPGAGMAGFATRYEEPVRRRGPGALIAAAAAVVALGTGAAFAGGLFSGGQSEQDQALPDIESMAPFLSAAPKGPSSGTPSASKKPGSSPSASLSALSASPSASASTAPSPSASAAPGSGASASPSVTASAAPLASRGPASPATPVTLQRGDSGSEVVELQERLAQYGLYDGPSDGRFDNHVEWGVAYFQAIRGITADAQGVYGPTTREALEAETQYPSGNDWDDDWNGGNGGGHGH
ncbi:peptidoglycan-binding domain-containing protein [Streptomyces sp. NPDC019396]|uniref:peptidoglycan-binding domain-containing protein n=1 Tax=Streptomyces sp. NPDC019396 TaxID=3154687 RepID=UPI0033D82E55